MGIVFTQILTIIPFIVENLEIVGYIKDYMKCDKIETILGEQMTGAYKWKVSVAKKENGKKAGYYILGYPTKEQNQ